MHSTPTAARRTAGRLAATATCALLAVACGTVAPSVQEQSSAAVPSSPLDGASNATFSNETWAYDVAADSWEQMSPAVSPPPRNFHALEYHAGADRVILFGAVTSSSS